MKFPHTLPARSKRFRFRDRRFYHFVQMHAGDPTDTDGSAAAVCSDFDESDLHALEKKADKKIKKIYLRISSESSIYRFFYQYSHRRTKRNRHDVNPRHAAARTEKYRPRTRYAKLARRGRRRGHRL